MAKGISDLGKSGGYIYVTRTDGTSFISNIINNEAGVREAKLIAVEAAASSANLISSGSVTITALGGSTGNITGTLVTDKGPENQMANYVNVTGLTRAQAAKAVAVEINSTLLVWPATNFTAVAIDRVIHLFAPADTGATYNGSLASATTDDPSNITFTTVDFAGGAGTNSVYDEAFGFRFFLDANYAAASSSCAGEGTAVEGVLTNAIEITNDFIHILPTFLLDSPSILNDALTITRKGKEYSVEAETEGSAATDDLDTINPAGHSVGDIIHLRGEWTTKVVTVGSGGNIHLANGNDFVTGDYSKAITLQLFDKAGGSQNELGWFEICRTGDSVPSIANFRAATPAIPLVGTEGIDTLTATTGGTVTITVNSDKAVTTLTGVVTLVAHLKYELSTTGAVAGDIIWFVNAAQITKGAYNLTIGGAVAPVAFSADQALSGGWTVWNYFDGTNWRSGAFADTASATFKLGGENIKDQGIVSDKLTDEGRTEVVTVPVSFETDGLGDHKIEMPYSGSVTKISHVISELIEATNNGTVTSKDNASAVMSTATLTGGSVTGVIFTSSPTTNNTFSAGDVLTFTTAKSTAGGRALLSVKIRRD